MRIRINDEQRDISYGELVALQQEFEAQLDENGVIFDDEDSYEEALSDFIQQYIDGNDNPMIDLSAANVRPVRDSKRRRVKDNIPSERQYSDDVVKAVTQEVCNMWYNNVINEYGSEGFLGWCNDGEVYEGYFDNETDIESAMQLSKDISEMVDDLTYKYLNLDLDF